MLSLRRIAFLVLLLTTTAGASPADDAMEAELRRGFAEQAAPFLKTHCNACHGGDEPEADLDLTAFATMESIARAPQVWEIVLRVFAAKSAEH